MSSSLSYKGYVARIEFSAEDDRFNGHIAGIKEQIKFYADTVTDLKVAFEEGIEDYLKACQKLGKHPQRTYSGKLMLRMNPEIHTAVAMAAQISGKSINQWAAEVLNKEANK
jgi:predicted HicB family RNase H-like nuclease